MRDVRFFQLMLTGQDLFSAVSVLLIGVMITSALCAIMSAVFILLIVSGRIMAKSDDEVTLPALDEKILSGQ
uniref:Uncharacterized protein n=1 Tax=Ditylenchus dipsaci TaxID=166011 RepID=A0A915DPM4_9BILA